MTYEQRDLYEQAKAEILAEIEEEGNEWMTSIIIFRLFTVLQQIACGFWNQRKMEVEHTRIDLLLAIIERIPSCEKVIIWTKYQHDITAIHKALGEVALFHGGLSERKRNEQLARFRGDTRFLLATQSCGGHGLTLNEACYVIYYNNAFKYSERLQSEDRCHRIGQERTTTYIDIQCANSIDDRIARALAAKGDTVKAFREEVAKAKDAKRLKDIIAVL